MSAWFSGYSRVTVQSTAPKSAREVAVGPISVQGVSGTDVDVEANWGLQLPSDFVGFLNTSIPPV